MYKIKLLILLPIICVINKTESAKILSIFPMPSPSHHLINARLMTALAARGDNVTVVSPYSIKNKVANYREIVVEELNQLKIDQMSKLLTHNNSFFQLILKGFNIPFDITRIIFENEQVEQLKSEQFDLLILHGIFPEPFLALAHHFKAPVIVLNTKGQTSTINKLTGNPSPPSWVSTMMVELDSELSFKKRVKNTISSVVTNLILAPLMAYKFANLFQEYFPGAPSSQTLIEEYVALILLNSHYSIESPLPHLPNMIQIGGIQIEDPKPLPKDLQEFLDSAKNGAILFSFGSNLKIAQLEKDKLEAILQVLGSLSEKVLFKSEIEIENLPKNIKLNKWLPQNDILAHKNMKLFITHGGLLSTTEAVYHGVPLVGVPFYGDQRQNLEQAVNHGYALRLELDNLNKVTFKKIIDEALHKPKILENIQLRSSLLRDRPMKPLDTALYWIDHVLKYKGGKHLQCAKAKLNLIQYLSLDVFALLIFLLILLLFIIKFVVKCLIYSIKKLFCTLKLKKD